MGYIEINTDKEFDAAFQKYKSQPIVIDFSAAWCGPCKAIAPLFKKLSESTPDVKFFKVDIDGASKTADNYEVNSVPFFAFVKGGEVVATFSGASESKLREGIKLISQ